MFLNLFNKIKNPKQQKSPDDEIFVIEKFFPKGKSFVFNFDKNTCEKVRTGLCKIDEISIYKDNLKEFEKYSTINKCTDVAYSILKNGYDCEHCHEVFIYEYNCGHYRCHNGQHRTCLAAKLDIPIRAEFKKLEENCDACRNINNAKLETL